MTKIMKTVTPENPIRDFNKWMRWLNKQDLTPEEKFEANFMRIWQNYKQDIINARTNEK